MIVVSALMLPVMIVRFYMGWFEMVLIDLPLIAASFWSISAFYVVAHRELFPKTWKRAFLFLPALMAAGVALTIINIAAVIEALVGYQTGVRAHAQVRDRRRAKSAPCRTSSIAAAAAGCRMRSWPSGRSSCAMVIFAIESLQLPGDSVPAAVRRRILTGPAVRRYGKSIRASSNGNASASSPMRPSKRKHRASSTRTHHVLSEQRRLTP